MEVTVDHIVGALMKASAEAEVMAEQFPEYQSAFLRFAEDASRAQREIIRKIRPELLETSNGTE